MNESLSDLERVRLWELEAAMDKALKNITALSEQEFKAEMLRVIRSKLWDKEIREVTVGVCVNMWEKANGKRIDSFM